jgi:O-methyltransferase involved in polyketide biosynthesis
MTRDGGRKAAVVSDSGTPDRIGDGEPEMPAFDTSVANPARIWNYWLGGKDNFAADREAAEQVLEVIPSMPLLARLARQQLIDVVRQLAGEFGVRQFLDIGTGLPTASNTHEIAQQVAPESRIVYVDNDPVVIAHAQALLTSSPQGKTDYLHADLRDTGAILAGAAQTLDFRQPVAVLLMGVLHFIPDADRPHALVARLMDAMPPGSFLVIGHGASDIHADVVPEMTRRYNERASASLTLRSRDQVARFFAGLELIEPGVVPVQRWRPASDLEARAKSTMWCGVARR